MKEDVEEAALAAATLVVVVAAVAVVALLLLLLLGLSSWPARRRLSRLPPLLALSPGLILCQHSTVAILLLVRRHRYKGT